MLSDIPNTLVVHLQGEELGEMIEERKQSHRCRFILKPYS